MSEAKKEVSLFDIGCEQTPGCLGNAMLPGKQLLMLEGKRSCPTCFTIGIKILSRCVRIPFMDLKLIRDMIEIGQNHKALVRLDELIKEKSEEKE